MSGNLIDTYAKALAELEEFAFQEAIVQRLLVALSNFQTVPSCRWVAPDVDVVLRGPKEFVDQYGVDESTMMWLMHKSLYQKMDSAAELVSLPHGPTFDLKMTSAEDLLPESREAVQAVANDLRNDWQRAVVFEQELSDRMPDLHAALERGRRRLLMKVRTHPTSSPWEAITLAQDFAESIFSDDFSPIYGTSLVRDLSSGEVAWLVGACPINWKVKAGNGHN